MWTAKFKIKHDCWVLDKTKKYGFWAIGIPLNSFEKDGKKYHTSFDILKGSQDSKNKFVKSLEKDSRVQRYERFGDQLFTLVEGEDFIAHVFDPSLFFIKPVLQKEGYEYWELGSWERRKLVKFFQDVKEFAEIEMMKLSKGIPQLIFHQATPRLTKKQQEIFELAQEYGYYQYPRKISVKELAKRVKMPRTTLQEHLRKAESKIMGLFSYK